MHVTALTLCAKSHLEGLGVVGGTEPGLQPRLGEMEGGMGNPSHHKPCQSLCLHVAQLSALLVCQCVPCLRTRTTWTIMLQVLGCGASVHELICECQVWLPHDHTAPIRKGKKGRGCGRGCSR